MDGGDEHVSERFRRLLSLPQARRRQVGRAGFGERDRWGGDPLVRGGPQGGRIGSPGLAKLEAISKAMGFSSPLRFGGVKERVTDGALLAAPEGETVSQYSRRP